MAYSQLQSVNERSPYWDNIKGILIALVVLGHFLWDYWGLGSADLIVKIIYIFHMPAFIFMSGFFSKSERSRSMKSILKLMIIYIIFNTVIMIFSFFLFGTSLQLITPSYSAWFLISLIIWRLVIKYIGESKATLKISIIFAILIGFWSDVTNVLAISRTIVFFPFFIIGYKLPTNEINKFINNRKPLDYLKGILLLIFAIILSSIFIYKFTGLSKSNLLMESFVSPMDLLARIVILCIAGLMTMSIAILMPRKKLAFLGKWGRHSLIIYILHRFITLVFVKFFPVSSYNGSYIIFALCASIITLISLGSDIVSYKLNRIIDKICNPFLLSDISQKEYRTAIISKVLVVLLVIFLSLPILTAIILPKKTMPVVKGSSLDLIHKVMTSEQEAALKGAVSIAFVGDLILLQDQVREAYSDSSGEYEFDSMFKYARKYLTEADFSIGIFEGPTASEEKSYSTSNFDDGLPLYLNYPDSFAKAVKDSGIDLVSTANNHLLDKGEEGALRTLNILDEVGLLHVGSYRNVAEKNSIMIVEKKGIRVAVLAYTYGSNGYTEEYFLQENTSLTSTLAEPNSRYFEGVRVKVLSDFQKIKNMKSPPDLIVVIPHMGSQFMHDTDTYQDTWNDIFINAGADIILGDHSHAVQPIEFRKKSDDNGKERRLL